MDWTATRPTIEIAAEWIAAAVLGAAVTLSLALLAPGSLVAAACGGAAAAAAALFVQDRIAPFTTAPGQGFTPVDFVAADANAEDELLLDDPLPRAGKSRVVRLFGAAPGVAADGAIPAPGEMLARIENFLGAGRATAPPGATPPANPASAEASAALHAALADIRRSLGQR